MNETGPAEKKFWCAASRKVLILDDELQLCYKNDIHLTLRSLVELDPPAPSG